MHVQGAQEICQEAVTLWAVIDPIGTVPLFLIATRHLTKEQRCKVAGKAVLISAVILMVFIVIGQILLEAMGIRMPSFQIAGGLVLFLFGISMIFQQSSPGTGDSPAAEHDVAVFPLAVPSIAGPAAMMAVVVLTDNDRQSIPEQAITAVTMLTILGITYIMLRLAELIKRLIGDGSINILSRVMGLILTALAVETVVDGIGLINRGA